MSKARAEWIDGHTASGSDVCEAGPRGVPLALEDFKCCFAMFLTNGTRPDGEK